MNNSQLIHQDTGNVEWYTPAYIVDKAREVLGRIDLDPASCDEANKVVKASTFYTMDDDGLSKVWKGKVWMNHPFGKATNKKWIDKLVSSYEEGEVEEAICICFASTSEQWFQPLMRYTQCYVSPRVKYYSTSKAAAPPKGSVVTYLGHNREKFYAVFHELGNVMVPY